MKTKGSVPLSEPGWYLTEKQKESVAALREIVRRSHDSDESPVEGRELDDGTENRKETDDGLFISKLQMEEIQRLSAYAEEVSGSLDKLNVAVGRVDSLLGTYNEVSTKTASLHDACEQLMSDQTQLATSAEEIKSRLEYFSSYESILHKLNSPHLSITGESFQQILNTIDKCLLFLQNTFAAKYTQCLSRAMTLVRSHAREQLRQAADTVKEKLAALKPAKAAPGGEKSSAPGSEEYFAVLYGVFASTAPTFRVLMDSIESRAEKSPTEEYPNALIDVRQVYFEIRNELIGPTVDATIRSHLSVMSKNPCSMVRTLCGFLIRVCLDEETLFYRFFAKPSAALIDFMELLCSPLYDTVRPIILQSPHLEALSELCSILQNEYLEDKLADGSEASEGLGRVVLQLVGDARERLVYRAGIYARSDIGGYKPAPGDLAYPEKLEMMKSIAESMAAKATDGDPAKKETTSPADMHGLWYPPVRRTILCLSKLYKCLDPAVFQHVSQDVIGHCIDALRSASAYISTNKTELDGQLFLVKHVLILREQTTPFRKSYLQLQAAETASIASGSVSAYPVSFKDTYIRLGRIRDAAFNLFNHPGRLFSLSNNALLEFLLQTPKDIAEQTDTSDGRMLDLELKTICQTFIQHVISKLLLSDHFLAWEQCLSSGTGDSAVKKTDKDAAEARDLISQVYRKIKENWPKIKKSLNLYISSPETESILMSHIRKNVLDVFKRLSVNLSKSFSEEQLVVIACPKTEQVNLLIGVV